MTTKQNTFFTYVTRRINVIYCMHTLTHSRREKERTIRNIQCHFISSFTAYIIRLLKMERFSIKFMAFIVCVRVHELACSRCS